MSVVLGYPYEPHPTLNRNPLLVKRNSLDALDALSSRHQLEPELRVHHLGQAAGHHVPVVE